MMKVQEDKEIDIDYVIKYKTMLPYCLKWKKNTKSMNPVFSKTKNGRKTILSKCAICGTKK